MKTLMSSIRGASDGRKKASNKNIELIKSIDLRDAQVLDANKIDLGPLIGRGGFAKVYKCGLDGQEAVAKVIDSTHLNEELTYLLTNECTIWARLAHPSIVSFLGMAATSAAMLLVCEWLPGGSLQDQLEKNRKSNAAPPEQLPLVNDLQMIVSGMEYLHSLEPPVLHRDLKSANILCDGARLAIADFGLARYQAAAGKKMTAETGSYRWMAPEVIRHEEYDKRCDVYSFAILAWEMLTYQIPFSNMMPVEAAFAVAKEAKRPPIPRDWNDKPVAEMLRACWHQDKLQRPAFSAVLRALDEEVMLLREAATPDEVC